MECTINIELDGVLTEFSFLDNTFGCGYVNGFVDVINPEEGNGELMYLIVYQSNTRYTFGCGYVNGFVDVINPEEGNGELMYLIVYQSNTRYIYQTAQLSSKASVNLVHTIAILFE